MAETKSPARRPGSLDPFTSGGEKMLGRDGSDAWKTESESGKALGAIAGGQPTSGIMFSSCDQEGGVTLPTDGTEGTPNGV